MDKNRIRLILFTWSINMLAVTLTGFFPKVPVIMTARGLFNVLVIIYLFRYFEKPNKISKSIILFIIYLFISCLFSSNVQLSILMTVKASIGMLMFLVGYRFFKDYKQFNKLIRYYEYLFILILLTIAFSTLTGLGDTGYEAESYNSSTIMFGSIGVAITKLLVIPILIVPVYLFVTKSQGKKYVSTLLAFTGVILTLIAFKRSSSIALIAGILVYVILMNKRNIAIPIIYISVIALITFPIYQRYIFESYENRKEQLYYIYEEADDIEQEGRYWETLEVIEAMKNDDIYHAIFGSEIFNEFDYFNVVRMLHIDYNVILNGSGILGLLMFLSIYYFILKKAFFYYKTAGSEYLKIISISVISLVVFAMIISIGGSVRSFDFRGPVFLYIGAALGFIESEYHRNNYQMQAKFFKKSAVL